MFARIVFTPVALAIFITGCATGGGLSKPKVRDVVPRLESVDFEGVELVFDIGVDNPYPVPLVAPRFDYGVEAMNKTLAAGELTEGVRLPASGVGRFKLPVRITYRQAFEIARDLTEAQRVDYTLRGRLFAPEVTGAAAGVVGDLAPALASSAREIAIPVVYKGSFPVLRAPAFTAVHLAPVDFSATKVSVSALTEVMNPNDFPINLSEVEYDMKVAGVSVGRLKADSVNNEIPAGEKGQIQIKGQVSAVDTIRNIFSRSGSPAQAVTLDPIGGFETPYGLVNFKPKRK